jgi:hypothetical protein
MPISRKEFIIGSGAALLPVSWARAALSESAAPRGAAAPAGPCFNAREFGAKGDGQAKDTRALQGAVDAAGANGGTVWLPPGNYLCGTLRLKSHVALALDAGATLAFSPDNADFAPVEKLGFKTFADEETSDFHHALLRGEGLEHVSVVGPGTIDGNRQKRHGPKPIALRNCRHVTVRGLVIRNSPNYNLSLLGCDHVCVEGVTILNGHCDGIDPDCCRDVRIANCFVESWDDAIVPKASFALGHRRSSENITVTNCVLTSACNCFKLGTESSGDFKNVTLSNCTMFARPDLWGRRPSSGVSIEMVDGASLERVAISNLVMADVESPVFVRLGNRGRAQAVPRPDHLAGLCLSNIVATGASRASAITGVPGFPVRGITLSHLRIACAGGGSARLARKAVPESERQYPDADMFGDLPVYGLFCRHAEGLILDDVEFRLEQPDARPALFLDAVADVQLRSMAAAPPAGDEPVAWLHNARRCFLQGLRALPGTGTLFKVTGAETARLVALANDFSEAKFPFQFGPEVSPSALRQEANVIA